MAAPTISSATRSPTPTTGSTIANGVPIPLGSPPQLRRHHRRTHLQEQDLLLLRLRGTRASNMSTYSGRRSQRRRAHRRLWRSVHREGRNLRSTGMCSGGTAGRFGILIPATYQLRLMADAVRSAFIPYNNIGDVHQPGQSQSAGHSLPAARRRRQPDRSGRPEDDESVPEPPTSCQSQGIYDNWIASGAGRNSQRPVRHQDRPPLQREEPAERKVFATVELTALPSTASRTSPIPVAARPNHSTAHLFTLNDTLHLQSHVAADHDAWLHAGRVPASTLTTESLSHRSAQHAGLSGVSEFQWLQRRSVHLHRRRLFFRRLYQQRAAIPTATTSRERTRDSSPCSLSKILGRTT